MCVCACILRCISFSLYYYSFYLLLFFANFARVLVFIYIYFISKISLVFQFFFCVFHFFPKRARRSILISLLTFPSPFLFSCFFFFFFFFLKNEQTKHLRRARRNCLVLSISFCCCSSSYCCCCHDCLELNKIRSYPSYFIPLIIPLCSSCTVCL